MRDSMSGCASWATPGLRDFVSRLEERGVPHSLIAAGADLNPILVGSLWREMRSISPRSRPYPPHPRRPSRAACRSPRPDPERLLNPRHPRFLRPPAVPHRGHRRGALGPNDDRDLEPRAALPRAASHPPLRPRSYGPLRDRRITVAEPGSGARPSPRDARPGRRRCRRRGRIEAVTDKGHDLLLRAHADAAHRVPGLRLLIAGDGPMRGTLEQHAKAQNGDVRFLGFVSDIRSFMGRAT